MKGLTFLAIAGAALGFVVPAYADLQSYCAAYGDDIAAMRLSGQSILTGAQMAPLAEAQRAEVARAAEADCLSRFAPTVTARATVRSAAAAPAAPGALKAGSAAWKAYCTKKYSSFNPATGTYTGRSGKERPCIVTRD